MVSCSAGLHFRSWSIACSRSVVIGRVFAGVRMGEITLLDFSSVRKRTAVIVPSVSQKSRPSAFFADSSRLRFGLA